ncbi:FAD-dependent oxidoreductase [Sorangium sp. So ce124]|uniref:FAD-dependent oxidoreductase n=1 Tax=Sorangium sp. So ce124 TaxID=3133280 RepID=UPI003F5F121D
MTNMANSLTEEKENEEKEGDKEREGAGRGDRGGRHVTIYGAGIAGLTVAHELAERGFSVRVVECEKAYDRRGQLHMAVGGVARTHYAAARCDDASERQPIWCQSDLRPADARLDPSRNHLVTLEIRFAKGDPWLSEMERGKLMRQLDWCLSTLQEARKVEIEGYDDSDSRGGSTELAQSRAEAVRDIVREVVRFHPAMARLISLEIDIVPPSRPTSVDETCNSVQGTTCHDKLGERAGEEEIVVVLLPDGNGIKNEEQIVEWLKPIVEARRADHPLELVATADRDGPGHTHARALAERHLRAAKAGLWKLVKSRFGESPDLILRVMGEVRLVPGSAAVSVTLRDPRRAASVTDRSNREAQRRRPQSVGARMRVSFGPNAERALKPGSSPEDIKAAQRSLAKEANTRKIQLRASLAMHQFQANVEGNKEKVLRVHASAWRPVAVQFEVGTEVLPPDQVDALKKALDGFLAHTDDKEIHRIIITGYVDAERRPASREDAAGDVRPADRSEATELAVARASVVGQLVKEWLTAAFNGSRSGYRNQFQFELRTGRPGELAASVLDGLIEHNRVAVVDVRRVMLPGEHGFRFFPSYYNHVFDTMRRIPILDADGEETGRTVYDNVIPTPNQGVAQTGLSPLILPRSPPESAYERKERLSVLRDLGYTPLDILQFMLRTLRYMSTSSKRRAAELEMVSWWEYLQGYDPRTNTYRYRYSERFTRDITTQSRTLASFDAVWGDARTCGNTWVQLFYNWLQPAAKVDGTLNGPTSEAWLDPWRHYLTTRLGVKFVQGTLVRVELKEENGQETILPHVWLPDKAHDERGPGPEPDPSDYYVIATDPQTAEEVTRDLYNASEGRGRIGVPLGLDGFTTRVRPEPPEEGPGKARSPSGKFGLQLWDRFQTMSGIQFFFKKEDFKLNDGYVFFNKAAWALTSINSAQFWTRRPTEKRDGFTSLISVDLCDWDAKADGGRVVGKSMWECTANEIAEEVWRQITKEIRLAAPPSHTGSPFAGVPPRPTWFHIDRNIEFGKEPPDFERPVRNRTPYLVPIKADWRNRPGAQPWDPSPVAFNLPPDYPEEKRREGEWQARHGGYLVHWDKLVFAGVYLKTFTRMTTMEAANESGRHAANAILDHWLATRPGRWSPRHREAVRARADEDEEERIEEARHMRSSVFYTATPGGDYCKIWNPERWEMPDFMLAKQADERNFDLGLPHPWDICGLETIPSLLSHTINAKISGAAPNKLGASLPDSFEAAFETLLRSIYPEGGWDSMLDVLRRYRREIDEQMRNAAQAARGEPLP